MSDNRFQAKSLLCFFILAACGSNGSGANAGAGATSGSTGTAGSAGAGAGASAGSAGGVGATGGSIAAGSAGMAGGPAGSGGLDPTAPAPFTPVTELWIGGPDDPATTVIYAFSKTVPCMLISATGWDAMLPDGTQLLEMKAFGTTSGAYTVVTTKTPAPGEASVNFVFSSGGNATETFGSGGTVTLSKLNANANATGAYTLMFGTTALSGSFDATYCATGVEP